MRHASFPPIAGPDTRLLILGSLPGAASLAAGRYYAHPRNQFWTLVGDAVGRPLATLDYPARIAALQAAGIGLWDVIADAARHGSLDAAIRAPAPNDLRAFVGTLPALRTIAFNGATAARIGIAQLGEAAGRFRLLRLPSSSPAHAVPIAAKQAAWRAISP